MLWMLRLMKRKRNGLFYSKKEETINSISHGIGIAMGVIVSTLFLIKCYQAQNLWAAFGVWLYLFGMGGSYLASTLYHSLSGSAPSSTSDICINVIFFINLYIPIPSMKMHYNPYLLCVSMTHAPHLHTLL